MDAAFQFSAAPSSTARIRSGSGTSGARLAADAGIAFIVEREARNVMLTRIGLDAVPCPVGENADLLHLFSAGKAMILNFFQVGAGWRLLTTKARKPPEVRLQRAHERLNLTYLTALSGID